MAAHKDVIAEFVRGLLERTSPAVHSAVLGEEVRIRHQYGGQVEYIRKAPSQTKAQRIAASIASGASVEEASAAAGVSRAWAYRLLRRRAIEK